MRFPMDWPRTGRETVIFPESGRAGDDRAGRCHGIWLAEGYGSVAPFSNIYHTVIDECQDHSLLQFRITREGMGISW